MRWLKGVIIFIGLLSLLLSVQAQNNAFAIITPENAGELEEIQSIQLDTMPKQIVFNPNNSRQLSVVHSSGLLSIWSVTRGANILNSVEADTGPEERLNAIAYTPDGSYLVVAYASSCEIIVWAKGSDGQTFEIPYLRLCVIDDTDNPAVLLSVTDMFIAAAYQDGKVRVWSLGTGSLLATIYGYAIPPRSLALSADNTLLAIGWQNLLLYRIEPITVDVSLMLVTPEISENFVQEMVFHPHPADLPFFIQPGLTTLETVVGGGLAHGSPVMWNLYSSQAQPVTLEMDMLHRSQIAYNSTGHLLAVAGWGDSNTEEPCQSLEVCPLQIWHLDGSPDEPGQFTVNKRVANLQGPTGDYLDLAFSADDRFLALATTDNSISIWGIPQP